MLLKSLGEHLRELRKKRKLCQKQIADAVGKKTSTYAAYEEDRSTPDPVTMVKICQYFQISFEDLMLVKTKETA